MHQESQPRDSDKIATPQFVQTNFSPAPPGKSSSVKQPQVIEGVEENNLTFMEQQETPDAAEQLEPAEAVE